MSMDQMKAIKLDRQQYIVTVASWQVRWLRLLYIDFLHFIRDQEYLISIKGEDSDGPTKGFDYVEGSLITDESLLKNWRSSFFSTKDHGRISALAAQHGTIYCLEVSKYYSHFSVDQVHPSIKFPFKSIICHFLCTFWGSGSPWGGFHFSIENCLPTPRLEILLHCCVKKLHHF